MADQLARARQQREAVYAITENLTDHGCSELRKVALRVLQAGLRAANPYDAIVREVSVDGGVMSVPGRTYELNDYRRVWILGAGKASARLAQGLETALGSRITDGLVVVRRGSLVDLKYCQVLEADHPLPSDDSVKAAKALMEFAARVSPEDLVISCVTGGSSSLACLPADGISTSEKRRLHAKLLECGAAINEVNTVRKHTSAIKGGRLAESLNGATILNLTVSDVAGDIEDLICDLTVPSHSVAADAIKVLHDYQIWDAVAPSIRSHLQVNPSAELPTLTGMDIHTAMLVTGTTVAEGMQIESERCGYRSIILSTTLEGPAAGIGAVLASMARSIAQTHQPCPPPVVLIACGGESTVDLDHATFGAGGPNQELVLSAADVLTDGDPIVIAAIDSDGSDGGTNAAGGMVDGTTRSLAVRQGLNLRRSLRNHASYDALESLGDLLVLGPTHTNVNDFVLAVINEPGGARSG